MDWAGTGIASGPRVLPAAGTGRCHGGVFGADTAVSRRGGGSASAGTAAAAGPGAMDAARSEGAVGKKCCTDSSRGLVEARTTTAGAESVVPTTSAGRTVGLEDGTVSGAGVADSDSTPSASFMESGATTMAGMGADATQCVAVHLDCRVVAVEIGMSVGLNDSDGAKGSCTGSGSSGGSKAAAAASGTDADSEVVVGTPLSSAGAMVCATGVVVLLTLAAAVVAFAAFFAVLFVALAAEVVVLVVLFEGMATMTVLLLLPLALVCVDIGGDHAF